jgi:hypothetical protein
VPSAALLVVFRQLERICKQVSPRSDIGEQLAARTCNSVSIWSLSGAKARFGVVWWLGALWQGRHSGFGRRDPANRAANSRCVPSERRCWPARTSASIRRGNETATTRLRRILVWWHFLPQKASAFREAEWSFAASRWTEPVSNTVARSTKLRLQLSTTQGRLILSPISLSF